MIKFKMNFFSSSPDSIILIQIISLVLTILSFFVSNFEWSYILFSIILFYCYSILGISLMLHRYYSHKSFELNGFYKWFFTIFAVLAGRGSPLGWVYIHRIHHSFSDTSKDPHSPHNNNFNLIGFKPFHENKKINHFIIKDLLTPIQIRIDRFYLLIIATFLLLLSTIDYNLIFYVWSIPVLAVSITQTFFNYFAHMKGYRNFETRDKSTNNIYLWPFILGDAWHNNHHYQAKSISTKIKKYEFDPISILINFIKKN